MANAHAVHEPQHGGTPPTASLAAHHHLRHSLFLITSACPIDSCELVGTATDPPASPTTHGVGWVDQTSVVADARAVNEPHSATPLTASPAAHHHLCHSLNSTAGVHRAFVCELVGTATGPPTAPVHGAQWVDQTGAVANVSAPHSTSPRYNTSHCLSGHSSSPAPLPLPHGRCTPRPHV